MVALGKGAKVSPVAIQNDLKSAFASLPAPSTAEKKDSTFALRIGGADVFFGLMPAPIPWSDLEGPCTRNRLWPNAASELRSHWGHAIVSVFEECEPIERLRVLTAATAALVGTCSAVVGVYWCDSRVVMPPRMFREIAVGTSREGFPLDIWLDLHIGKDAEGKIAGYTMGMTALGHMELETWSSIEPPGELRDRFLGLACYLLANGPVIRDGDTIGEDEKERIKVVYSDSRFGHKNRVMRLDYESAARPTNAGRTTTSVIGRLLSVFRRSNIQEHVTLDDLQGSWQMISCGQQGNFAPKDMLAAANIVLRIEGNKYFTSAGGTVDEKGALHVDSSKQPVRFDQHIEFGEDAGSVHKGIVRLRDGQLEHCQGEVGQPRPKDFARKRKDTASLVLFQRI